jgi:DNA-binding response OmpR family regulator
MKVANAARCPLILIVDHDAATLAVCDELLRSVGYATIWCRTARAAQRYIHTDRPDLLLTDLHLDWYEAGWDLLCLLRRAPVPATIPVIVCSADRPLLRARQRQLQVWRCGVLEKPFSTGQLLTAVQAALAIAPLRSRAVKE